MQLSLFKQMILLFIWNFNSYCIFQVSIEHPVYRKIPTEITFFILAWLKIPYCTIQLGSKLKIRLSYSTNKIVTAQGNEKW